MVIARSDGARAAAVPGSATMARGEVAERQTRRSQTPLGATSCGVESHLRYQDPRPPHPRAAHARPPPPRHAAARPEPAQPCRGPRGPSGPSRRAGSGSWRQPKRPGPDRHAPHAPGGARPTGDEPLAERAGGAGGQPAERRGAVETADRTVLAISAGLITAPRRRPAEAESTAASRRAPP